MQDERINLSLRAATQDDKAFLLDVYASSREEELAGLDWDDNQKRAFVQMQFLARERSYPRVDDRIVLNNGRPIGRMLVDESDSGILLRDIALLTEYRNAGIGTRLIKDLMKEATASGKPLHLHVLQTSAAVRLYERLGFCKVGSDGTHFEMKWVPTDLQQKNDAITRYRINPYLSFIESRLVPHAIEHAVFNRLTNELLEPSASTRSVLLAAKSGTWISLPDAQLDSLGEAGVALKQIILKGFLITENQDPFTDLWDHYVARPIQNPAVAYRRAGEWILVRTSMEQTIYSRKRNELPLVIEEILSSLCADIFLMADGTKTLQQIYATLRGTKDTSILEDAEFREAIDFLTTQERQLIKLTLRQDELGEPFTSVNIVPRNLYHADRWDQQLGDSSREDIIDFHLHGIEEAGWEFDQIEPTINHCFRFPHEALGGIDYGSRFCLATLRPEVVPLLDHRRRLDVLEVGGGTGSFARSFLEQAENLTASGLNGTSVHYHILDLSPALMANQRKILSQFLPESRHFHQDATEFELPGKTFDLIISNEVVADFPVASIQRKNANEENDNNGPIASENSQWEGDGVYYLNRYELRTTGAPDSFLVNAGAFRFIERAWKHLTPGGTLIVSEYGAEHRYPARSYHLNHDEYSIHFGHLVACATKVGFQCRLLTLKDFLSLDDGIEVLNGREEHILCLNHVFKNYGLTLPYAVISKSDFERQCETVAREINLTGYSFLPIRMGYHFGPNVNDFFVLIMNKPT